VKPILCDTFPLVALINRKDNNHVDAIAALKTLRVSLNDLTVYC